MTLTEEEAKTKWCPQMASHSLLCDETERHGDHGGIIAARCIASQCMAWRWFSNDRELSGPNAKVLGFCGLAGKP